MSTVEEAPRGNVSEQLARLEGKIDAYMAGQSAIVQEHERRLSVHDADIRELRVTAGSHVTREEISELRPAKSSPWVIVATIVGAIVGLGSLLTLLIMLMERIPAV